MPRRFWSELVIEIALKAKFEKPVRTRVPLRLCRKQNRDELFLHGCLAAADNHLQITGTE